MVQHHFKMGTPFWNSKTVQHHFKMGQIPKWGTANTYQCMSIKPMLEQTWGTGELIDQLAVM